GTWGGKASFPRHNSEFRTGMAAARGVRMFPRVVVSRLGDRVQNSLDETRMLILGAQVLLGFQFQGTFQPGFERLPAEVQLLKLVGLVLMLIAVGLLLSPGAYHQIVEHGNDSTRVTTFTTRIAALALLPFAI